VAAFSVSILFFYYTVISVWPTVGVTGFFCCATHHSCRVGGALPKQDDRYYYHDNHNLLFYYYPDCSPNQS
jgi:hypothetical protein